MHAKDVVLQTLDWSDRITDSYLADLTDADLLLRPVPGMNPIAWQLGHLIATENRFLEDVCPGSAPALPEGFAEKHSKEAGQSDDPSHFYTKAEYVTIAKAQREATKAYFAKLTDAELDGPPPKSWERMVPSVGLAVNFLGLHTMMHVGQYVVVRRQVGKPIVI